MFDTSVGRTLKSPVNDQKRSTSESFRAEDPDVSKMVEAHIRNHGMDNFVNALGVIIPEMRLIAIRAKINNYPNTEKRSWYSVMEKTYLAISELPEK